MCIINYFILSKNVSGTKIFCKQSLTANVEIVQVSLSLELDFSLPGLVLFLSMLVLLSLVLGSGEEHRDVSCVKLLAALPMSSRPNP